MNTQFKRSATTRIKGLSFAAILTLAMLVSVDTLSTFDASQAQMAQGQTSSRG